MKKQDTLVSELLNELHRKREQSRTEHFQPPAPFKKGDKVWYLRPEKTGDKLSSRWLGPATVESQVGDSSYVIWIKLDKSMSVHRRFLNEWLADPFSGTPLPLYFFQRTTPDDTTLPGEFRVEGNHSTPAERPR